MYYNITCNYLQTETALKFYATVHSHWYVEHCTIKRQHFLYFYTYGVVYE